MEWAISSSAWAIEKKPYAVDACRLIPEELFSIKPTDPFSVADLEAQLKKWRRQARVLNLWQPADEQADPSKADKSNLQQLRHYIATTAPQNRCHLHETTARLSRRSLAWVSICGGGANQAVRWTPEKVSGNEGSSPYKESLSIAQGRRDGFHSRRRSSLTSYTFWEWNEEAILIIILIDWLVSWKHEPNSPFQGYLSPTLFQTNKRPFSGPHFITALTFQFSF